MPITDIQAPEPEGCGLYAGLKQVIITFKAPDRWIVIGMNDRETVYRQHFEYKALAIQAVESLTYYLTQP